MIGWKCDVGYTTKEPTSLTSLSDIVLTDIGSIYAQSQLNVPDSNITLLSKNSSELYNKVFEYGGSEADKLYSIPAGVANNNYVAAYKLNFIDSPADVAFPSMRAAYPNLWSFYLSSDNVYFNTAFIFRTLNKVVIRRYTLTAVYDIIGNSLTIINQFGISFGSPAIFAPALRQSARYDAYFPSGVEVNYNNLTSGPFYQFRITGNGANDSSIEILKNVDNQVVNLYLALFKDGYVPPDVDIPDNPYEPGGPSGPTDPDLPPGTFDDESDPIPDSPLPTLSAANTGFTRIYNPTLSQVQALAQYLWTTPDIIETIWNHIKQFFENPMDAIIGFNVVPVPVPDGGTENFKLMYIDTGVAMTAAANQFVDRDCGTVEIKRYYGSALDQSPYTKVSCFLPYIGTVQLNTDEVMGTTLQVKYRVDICSGSCVAKIFIDGNCLYQYSGHCAINIPISSADFSSYVSAAINVAKLAVGAATAGAGGVAGAAMVAQDITVEQQTHASFGMEDVPQPTNITTMAPIQISPKGGSPASFSGLSPSSVSNTVGEIMNSKPHVEHSGSFSGNTGYLGVRRPFIIIERPNMCMPANYQALNGFPAMITMELGTCKGFTRVQQVQLTGMTATNPEQAEILELLKSGVVL